MAKPPASMLVGSGKKSHREKKDWDKEKAGVTMLYYWRWNWFRQILYLQRKEKKDLKRGK